VLLPPDLRLVEMLRSSEEWQVVHQDDVSVLLTRELSPRLLP
jgi:hypothetical protein